jgi:hypothetical protein
MSTTRSALESTLLGLTYDGEACKTFDYGSTENAIDGFSSAVLQDTSGNHVVGIFIGDASSVQEPFSHGWRKQITEYDVLIAERRSQQVSHFETYVEDMSTALPPSNLGAVVPNILGVEVTDVGEVIQEANTWYQTVTVTVTQLIPVVLGADFRINVDLPTCSLDSDSPEQWAQEGATGNLDISVTIARGTGVLETLHVYGVSKIQDVEYSAPLSFGYTYSVQAEDEVVVVAIENLTGFTSGDTVEIHAVLTDDLGACAVATPVTVTIA